MSTARLILKQPTGWFAAGQEVAQALALLSDGAFRLYMHLCLQADRHTGRAAIEGAELARVLRKTTTSIEADMGELQVQGICERQKDQVEICDRFWPYEKPARPAPAADLAGYVQQVRQMLLRPACVRARFSAADERLAAQFHGRGVTLHQLERAIWLGCARKYVAMLNGQPPLPIASLAYFASLIEEVCQPQIPASYWDHVRRKMGVLEKRWLQTRNSAPVPDAVRAEPSSPEML